MEPFSVPSNAGMLIDKVYHWTYSKKNRLILHPGSINKCRRVHRSRQVKKVGASA